MATRYIPRADKELDRKDIEFAMSKTKSNKEASRYLNVSYKTWKKYASMFTDEKGKTLFEKHLNKGGKGTGKMAIRKGFEPGIMDVLEGRVNSAYFSPKRLKNLIIKEGCIKEECAMCGFNEQRLLDMKAPLLLNFKDGNKKNWLLNNLEFLCYNHYFIWIGDIFDKKQIEALEDSTVLSARAIDFELPEDKEKVIRSMLNFDNKGVEVQDEKRADDYGDDLIARYVKK